MHHDKLKRKTIACFKLITTTWWKHCKVDKELFGSFGFVWRWHFAAYISQRAETRDLLGCRGSRSGEDRGGVVELHQGSFRRPQGTCVGAHAVWSITPTVHESKEWQRSGSSSDLEEWFHCKTLLLTKRQCVCFNRKRWALAWRHNAKLSRAHEH